MEADIDVFLAVTGKYQIAHDQRRDVGSRHLARDGDRGLVELARGAPGQHHPGPAPGELQRRVVAEAAERGSGDDDGPAGLVGDVSAQQVVEATLEMETTLKLAVSVRDRLVEAYQQVMQMPI